MTLPAPDTAIRPRYLAEMVRSGSGETSDWHSHDFGQLISASTGSMQIGTENRVLLLSPAMAIWIPPDVRHWMKTSSNNQMLYVDVNREEAAHLGHTPRVLAMTPLLGALMQAVLPEAAGRSRSHLDALHDLLRCEFIAGPDVPLSLVLPQDSRIRPLAMAAIAAPGEIASVQQWLGQAPASRKTIERLFITETGMPPARWLRHARILHAIARLVQGEKVTSVALDMGYETTSAFGYMFRNTIGLSPSSFCARRMG